MQNQKVLKSFCEWLFDAEENHDPEEVFSTIFGVLISELFLFLPRQEAAEMINEIVAAAVAESSDRKIH